MTSKNRAKDTGTDKVLGTASPAPEKDVFPRPSAGWFSTGTAFDRLQPLAEYAAARVIPGILYPNRKAPLDRQEVAAIASLLNAHFRYFDWLDANAPMTIALNNNRVVASFRFQDGFKESLTEAEREKFYPTQTMVVSPPSEQTVFHHELAKPDFSLIFHDNIAIICGKLALIEYSVEMACITITKIDTTRLKTSDEKRARPRPDLPRWAEENRPTQMLRVRLEPDLIEALDRAARNDGLTRTEWLREAIQASLATARKPEPQ